MKNNPHEVEDDTPNDVMGRSRWQRAAFLEATLPERTARTLIKLLEAGCTLPPNTWDDLMRHRK